MAIFRARQRVTEELAELQTEALTGRTGMLLTLEESVGRAHDENSPLEVSHNALEVAAILRPSPRLPLQDITHLFPSNILFGNDRMESTRNATGLMDRVRRRPLDSPGSSKKRRISEATIPRCVRSSRPSSKSARPSMGLRSFR